MDAGDADPYAARPSRAYVHADAAASAPPPPPHTSAPGEPAAPYARGGGGGGNDGNDGDDGGNGGNDNDNGGGGDDDEPLFGGTPFRDAAPGGSATQGAASDVDSDKDAYYALLNLDRSASEAEIRDAYKSLAIVLHPDKHTDPARKAAAEAQFRHVRAAYEVLSSRERRAVYDHFGAAGLTSSWTVSTRGQTAAELRTEIERDVLAQRVKEAEGLVQSRADFAAHIDASALLAPPERVPRPAARNGLPVTFEDRWNRVGVTQLLGKHSFDTQVTEATSVQFSGHMLSRQGLGGGNFLGTIKTQVSPRFSSEWSCSLLRPRILTHKGSYAFDSNTFVQYQANMQHPAVPPVVSLTFGQRISSRSFLTGFTSLRSGTYQIFGWGDPNYTGVAVRPEPASAAVGLTNQTADGAGWTLQASLSPLGQGLSLDWGTKVLGGVKLRLGGSVGTATGLAVHATGERRVTETVRLGLGVSTGLPGPVTLRLKLNRLGQKVTVPIVLSPDFRADLMAALTLVPAVGMTALHYGYLLPRRRRKIADKLRLLREENNETILERQQSARGAREILRDQAAKKVRAELDKDGLVILQAWYGSLSAFPPAPENWDEAKQVWADPSSLTEDADGATWDVRVPLQAMIQKGQLIIPGGRAKSHILGFFDPCMGEKKHLVIRYLFRGRPHEALVDDINPVALPVRAHQLL